MNSKTFHHGNTDTCKFMITVQHNVKQPDDGCNSGLKHVVEQEPIIKG
jgi:hypothetical protein